MWYFIYTNADDLHEQSSLDQGITSKERKSL